MGKFVGILNADSQNICTCQLFSFWALFDATASPVFIQTGMKSAFSYTQCLRPETDGHDPPPGFVCFS